MIPKLIHFVWLDSPLPEWAERNIAEFRRLNPEHEIRVHGADAICDEFRRHATPGEHPSTRSDLIRYGILERDGGWYFDVDYWPVRPVADIERAYGLDGSQLFAAWMNNPRINNGVLGCGPGLPLWRTMAKWIHDGGETGTYGGRTKYGPRLVTRLFERHPETVRIASFPWFHGVPPELAPKAYRHVVRTGSNAILARLISKTDGQLPFAVHLWAHTDGQRFAGEAGRVIGSCGSGDRLVAVCGRRAKHEDGSRPWLNIAEACAELGFRVEIVDYLKSHALDRTSDFPEIAVFWNGLKGVHARHADRARAMGCKRLVLEHGFFDRSHYFQADHAGILHRASWRTRLADPAPPEGRTRLARFYPDGLRPIGRRRGYVLVLGQVNGDSQMLDSEITGSLPLQRLVKGSLPPGVQAYYRPHPQVCAKRWERRDHVLPVFGGEPDPEEMEIYKRTRTGRDLAEALGGAAFAVAINSNALNEALALGIPAMAMGPFLGIDAGVVHPTSQATFRNDLGEMLDGWRPDQAAVENYLAWLAARQWNVEEFRSPKLLAGLLRDAGVDL